MTLTGLSETIFRTTYASKPGETWQGAAARVAEWVSPDDSVLANRLTRAISERKLMPGGRYLYAAGRNKPQNTNCFLLRAEDSAEGWSELLRIHVLALSKGGGVGTEYSDVRGAGQPIRGYGGTSSGPISLMMMVNSVARNVQDGASRRAALWAGLNWNHPDVNQFIRAKDWSLMYRMAKELDPNYGAPLDMTNISIGLDEMFFAEIDRGGKSGPAWDLYRTAVRRAMKTGEPGFSINVNRTDNLRNPCTEVTSDVNGDCCNLASVNFSRIENLNELEEITELAVELLWRGLDVGWLPDPLFREVRERGRRIGLGLMGLHEWCLTRGIPYGPHPELETWLQTWRGVSETKAHEVAKRDGKPVPTGIRAIAPTGTIGIIAGTTTGIEPLYCVAYKRRFLREGRHQFEYVIDPVAQRLIEKGIAPDSIEDAMFLSADVERRLSMQAFVQGYVDQAISSTINLPEFGHIGNTDPDAFADMLYKYLPKLRGVTMYPDGARSWQPITKVDYREALEDKNKKFEQSEDACKGGSCGI